SRQSCSILMPRFPNPIKAIPIFFSITAFSFLFWLLIFHRKRKRCHNKDKSILSLTIKADDKSKIKIYFTFFFAIILFFFPVSDILETEKEFIAAAQKASRKQVLLFASFL